MTRLLPTPLLLALLVTAGCDSANSDEVTLRVYAASSLRATFTELGAQFEAAHPGVQVEFDFAGSSDLVSQIQQGAPADVIATADAANMAKLDNELDTDPVDFATNTLEIAVPPGNPAGIATLVDLASTGVNLVVCAPQVPCGAAAAEVATLARLSFHPVSEEQNVADVLGKVISGEADAGLVYVTDVRAAGDQVEGISFPESDEVVNTYPIAQVGGADEPDLAEAFIGLVTSSQGQAVLADAGFGTP